jgi:hypothetical protein
MTMPTRCPRTVDDAGFGALKTAIGLLPLKALEIETHIHSLAAETILRQVFVNACPEPLEAGLHRSPAPDQLRLRSRW